MALLPFSRLSLLALLLPSGGAWALDATRSIAQHSLDGWNTVDGLPRNNVSAVVQTEEGFLWFATSEGLARLEGSRFRSWSHDDFPAALTLNATALVADAQPGALWVGTAGGGLLRFDYHTGDHRLYTEQDGLCGDTIEALAVDSDGGVWIGTNGALACRWDGEAFEPFPVTQAGASGVVDIATDEGGGAYLAAMTDAILYAPPGAKKLQILKGLPAPASSVLVDGKGVLVGSAGAGVFEFRWDTASFEPRGNGVLSTAFVRSLLRDQGGALWVGTSKQGVVRLVDGQPALTDERSRLPARLVTDMAEDREGSLWITTGGTGVLRLVDHRLHTISARHGLSYENVWSLAPDGDGDVLIGTGGGGIYRLAGDKVERFRAHDAKLADAVVLSLYTERNGTLWAALLGQGVARIAADRSEILGPDEGLSSALPSVVQGDRQGRLWVGHQTGAVDWLEEGHWRHYGPESGLPAVAVTAIHQDSAEALWVGTRGAGVALLQDDRFRVFTSEQWLADDTVYGIHEAGDGTLWFATASGLTRLQGETSTSIGRTQGLPAGEVYDLVQDHKGDFWLSTDSGVVHLPRQEVARFVAGDTERVDATRYDRGHGMLTSECNGGTQPNLLKAGNGTIYAATTAGVVVIEPLRSFDGRDPPQVTPSRMWVDGSPHALAALQDTPVLSRGDADVTIEFLATSYLVPRETVFRYRLHGLDDDWIMAGPSRTARYPKLQPGRYRFEVQASQDETWTAPSTSLPFRIARQPWQWTWPYVLAGLIAMWAGHRSYRRRLAGQRQRELELEQALESKARELREATLVDPLTGLRNRRFVTEVVIPEVVAFISQKVQIQQTGTRRRSTAETGVYGVFLFDVDHFKGINDTLGHEAGDRMLQQMSYLLRRSVRQDDFVVRWGGEEFLVVLRFADRDHLDHYARRVREQVETTTFLVSDGPGGALKKTTSLGYVSLPFFDEEPSMLEFEQALQLADQALYIAKDSGRNRAVRVISTGKVPAGTDLRRIVRSVQWGIDNGYLRLESFSGQT